MEDVCLQASRTPFISCVPDFSVFQCFYLAEGPVPLLAWTYVLHRYSNPLCSDVGSRNHPWLPFLNCGGRAVYLSQDVGMALLPLFMFSRDFFQFPERYFALKYTLMVSKFALSSPGLLVCHPGYIRRNGSIAFIYMFSRHQFIFQSVLLSSDIHYWFLNSPLPPGLLVFYPGQYVKMALVLSYILFRD